MTKAGTVALKCSFCGKGEDQVKYLLAGPDAHICGECVSTCSAIIEREAHLEGNR